MKLLPELTTHTHTVNTGADLLVWHELNDDSTDRPLLKADDLLDKLAYWSQVGLVESQIELYTALAQEKYDATYEYQEHMARFKPYIDDKDGDYGACRRW